MKAVYLDHAATTPTDEAVVREMLPYFSSCFGNASSLHKDGREAVAAVDLARERVAKALGAAPSEIYFTSGGTEADNWAIEGLAGANSGKGKHVVVSSVEHPAVLSAAGRLEERGFEVTYLPVDEAGRVSLADVKKALRDDTVLLSVMFVNNEVGAIQPIKEIAGIAKEKGVLFHTDAVQAAGVLPIDVKELGVDALTVSGHKFYGPKGVGALYLRRGVRVKGLVVGGEQERSLRGGTYNTPAIVGLGFALEKATERFAETSSKLSSLKNYFLKEIKPLGFTRLNGGEPSHPGIANVLFYGVKNSELLSALDQAGIEASAGSACSSGSVEPSHVLTAMGLSEKEVRSSIRFSFGRENTFEDLDRAVAALNEILPRIRKESDLFKACPSKRNDL